MRDVIVSIRAVAEVMGRPAEARTSFLIEPRAGGAARDPRVAILDTFFQLLDPEGEPGRRSLRLRRGPLPLSADARRNAARGTLDVRDGRPAPGGARAARHLARPADGRPAGLVQVGMTLTAGGRRAVPVSADPPGALPDRPGPGGCRRRVDRPPCARPVRRWRVRPWRIAEQFHAGRGPVLRRRG